MKDDSIEISKKRLPLRIALFILALAVAIGSFVIGINRKSGNVPGYAVISARADGDAPRYATRFRLTYRFGGSSRAIRTQKNEIADAYSDALSRLYKLLDPENSYPGFAGNLADLNRHPNQDYTITPELFAILADAMERTERGEGFSIYAAPLLAEWESIAYASDAAAFDPVHNPEEAERLREIAAQCADRGNCRLEIVDEAAGVVRLNVSEAYQAFLQAYELPRTVLDLGQMKDAYILRGLAAALEERGFADGFLNTVGGLTVSLSGPLEGEYEILSYVNQSVQLAASVPVTPGAASAAFTAFPTEEGSAGYYAADGLMRCAARPAAAEDAPISAVFVLRRDGDVAAACYEALCLFLGTEVPENVSTASDLLVYSLMAEDGTSLYAFGKERDQILQKDGFRLIFNDILSN